MESSQRNETIAQVDHELDMLAKAEAEKEYKTTSEWLNEAIREKLTRKKEPTKKRKYSNCAWCGSLIDVMNRDRELCDYCFEFKTQEEMLIARQRTEQGKERGNDESGY